MFSLISKAGALCFFSSAALALTAALAPPSNFKATAINGNDKALLTWTSSADQVRVFAQKKLLSGQWEAISGYPKNMLNQGSHVIDTNPTVTGTLRFFLKAKQASTYSAETPKIVLKNMH